MNNLCQEVLKLWAPRASPEDALRLLMVSPCLCRRRPRAGRGISVPPGGSGERFGAKERLSGFGVGVTLVCLAPAPSCPGIKLPAAQTDPRQDFELSPGLEGPEWRASAAMSWGPLPVGTAWDPNLPHPRGHSACRARVRFLPPAPKYPQRGFCGFPFYPHVGSGVLEASVRGSPMHSHLHLVQSPENMPTFKAKGKLRLEDACFY